ncbi:MAG: N-acetyltransferase [Prevotella sp.]|nr:N-acetyltransferase [Prevotella sp.]
MERVSVKAVTTGSQLSSFVRFPARHYAGCPLYVPDLERDVRAMFDPRKNSGLEFSDVQAFLACRGQQVVGRIVGIVNRRANEKWHKRYVRFSHIEFTDDPEVSRALLEAVGEWGRQRGMDCIQGPMGITDFDKEGMLVEDFDLPGSLSTIYNYDYYPRHLEALGFAKEADWLQVRVAVPAEVPAVFARVARFARERLGLHVRKVTNSEIRGGYGRRIFTLLNQAYSPLFGYTELTDRQMDEFQNQYIPLVDKQMMPLVENAQGELVGVAITMASLSDAMRRSGGRLWPTGWWHLLRGLTWHRSHTVEMLLIGVRPDYQGKGVNALFFDDLIPIYNKYGMKWAETGPQLEDNTRELSQWKALNPQTVKRRRCYTKKI